MAIRSRIGGLHQSCCIHPLPSIPVLQFRASCDDISSVLSMPGGDDHFLAIAQGHDGFLV